MRVMNGTRISPGIDLNLNLSPLLALLLLALVALAACSDPAEEGTSTGTECVMSDLISQCPNGSFPELEASSTSMCSASAEVDIVFQEGEAAGACYGSGDCKVLCRFVEPCKCDVEMITEDGIVCDNDSCLGGAACGDGVCEAGENATDCPGDCGPQCEANKERCDGNARQVCSLSQRWERVACPDNTQCSVTADDRDLTECVPSG